MVNLEMFKTCLEKQQRIKTLFSNCCTPGQKYEKIIELGRSLPPYPLEFKTPEHLVKGCQSEMYLQAQFNDGKLQFTAHSEALVSAGLAALLLLIYNDEPPEAIIACAPAVLDELGISASLSPSRSNGLASLFQNMKRHAIKFLIPSNN